MCAHVHYVALCGNTVKKCCSRSQTGWPPLDICYASQKQLKEDGYGQFVCGD